MNIITDFLPDFVNINGTRIRLRTDFRIWIEFDRLLHDTKISPDEKIAMIAALCMEKPCGDARLCPDDVMTALCEFYLAEERGSPEPGSKRIFSPYEDGNYIYAAFLSEYGIDLLSIPYMHWFVFSALLRGLGDDCRLMKIMSFRTAKPENEKNPIKRRYLRKMKELYALPDMSDDESRDREFAEALSALCE